MSPSSPVGSGVAGVHRWTASSETGSRLRNEDRWDHRKGAGDIALWVLADGMGGHDDGDVAAEVGVSAFLDSASAHGDPELAVRKGIGAAREAVSALRGKGVGDRAPSSTLVCLAVQGRKGFVCHAGDSVLFQFRRGRLVHRTRDHNVRELKRAVSGLVPLSAANDPDASKLTRSLGDPLVDDAGDTLSALEVREGDLLLLCSDGISQQVPDDSGAWASGARDESDLLELARRTVVTAHNPRQDNYTAIAIRVGQVAGAARFQSHWSLYAPMLGFLALAIALGFQSVQKVDDQKPRQSSLGPGVPKNLPADGGSGEGKRKGGPGSTRAASDTVTKVEVTATTSPLPVLEPESPAVPQLAVPPKTTCRTVYQTRQECRVEQQTTLRCQRNSGKVLKFEKTWPNDDRVETQSEAEGSCRAQAHDFIRGGFVEECDGILGKVTIRCDCAWNDGATATGRCFVAAHASCRPKGELCEDVIIPHKLCHPVRIKTQVCS